MSEGLTPEQQSVARQLQAAHVQMHAAGNQYNALKIMHDSSIFNGNTKEADELRLRCHAELDNILDASARIQQLTRKMMESPPPGL